MARLPVRVRLDSTLPFTRAEARLAGIPMRDLAGPMFRRLFYNLYVSAATPVTALLRARAALKVSPRRSHASHFTAGEIWGGCVPQQPCTHVSSPREQSRCQRRGICNHDLHDGADVVVHRGVRVSSPTQTFLDLAAVVDLVELVVFGDSIVKSGHVTPAELVRAADAWSCAGRRRARRAARLVRRGVDSPMESRLRMLIVLAGLPEPEVNVVLRNENGEWLVRFDLCYRGLKLVVEYDGRQHAEDDGQWDRDIDRREDLDAWGYRLVVVRSKGIYVEPQRTLERIARALRERGCRTVPRRLKEEWQQYFPGRPPRSSFTHG
jgi:very-short-patch-repair endonuclease